MAKKFEFKFTRAISESSILNDFALFTSEILQSLISFGIFKKVFDNNLAQWSEKDKVLKYGDRFL